jgi:Tol biopolymer transport system component
VTADRACRRGARGVGAGRRFAAVLLFLLSSPACDTSDVAQPISGGIVWTRITSASDIDQPSYPDWRGNSLVFQFVGALGTGRLATVRDDGTAVFFLPTSGSHAERAPRWVNDTLVVHGSNQSGTGYDVWYRSLSGATARRLTSFAGDEWTPAPRPGKPGIAYTEGSSPMAGRIVVIPDTAAAPLELRFITPAGLQAGEPDWSPDGTRLAFTADSADGSRHVWLAALSAGDTTLTQLTTGPFRDVSPRYSPDGSRILFSSDRTGRQGIWWVSPAGEGTGLSVIAFENAGATILAPSWSPDGTRIVLSSDGRGLGRALWVLSNIPF